MILKRSIGLHMTSGTAPLIQRPAIRDQEEETLPRTSSNLIQRRRLFGIYRKAIRDWKYIVVADIKNVKPVIMLDELY